MWKHPRWPPGVLPHSRLILNVEDPQCGPLHQGAKKFTPVLRMVSRRGSSTFKINLECGRTRPPQCGPLHQVSKMSIILPMVSPGSCTFKINFECMWKDSWWPLGVVPHSKLILNVKDLWCGPLHQGSKMYTLVTIRPHR